MTDHQTIYWTPHGRKWRRFKCKKCGAVVSFNNWNNHVTHKHPDAWRLSENPWQEFFGWDSEEW